MTTTYNNQNLFQDSVVFGEFINADNIQTGGNQANAKFKRNVLIGGDLTLGLESSTTTNGVTSYTDTGGNILVRKNGITYTITPQILKNLSTITDNVQTQIDNITTPDLSSYAPKNNATFTGETTAVEGDLVLGKRTINLGGQVIGIKNTGGNIIFKIGNYDYTITPTILFHLRTISDNVQSQIDLCVPKASPEFTGKPVAPLPTTIDNAIATTEWVSNYRKSLAYQYITGFSTTQTIGTYDNYYRTIGQRFHINGEYSNQCYFKTAEEINIPATESKYFGWVPTTGSFYAPYTAYYTIHIDLCITYNSDAENKLLMYVYGYDNGAYTIKSSKVIFNSLNAFSTATQFHYTTTLYLNDNGNSKVSDKFEIIFFGAEGEYMTLLYTDGTNISSENYCSIRVIQNY